MVTLNTKNQSGNYWEEKDIKKRWEILQGQTLNMVWNDIIAENSKDFEEKIKTLKERYPRLLAVNTQLITGEENSSPQEVAN